MPRAKVVPGVTVESDSIWDANRHLNKDQVDAQVRFYEDLGSPGRYLTPGDLIDAFKKLGDDYKAMTPFTYGGVAQQKPDPPERTFVTQGGRMHGKTQALHDILGIEIARSMPGDTIAVVGKGAPLIIKNVAP